MSKTWFYILLAVSAAVIISAPISATTRPSVQYLPAIIQGRYNPTYWKPVPGTDWQIQFTGALDTSLDVQMFDLDLFDTPQTVIEDLHARKRRVICYFSAGSWEDWRPDSDKFPQIVLGKDLQGWPGEKWLDIRQISLLEPIMTARLDLAARKGCDGVDPDNVDGYQNDSGFPLSYQDQLIYNKWLAQQAHARHLSVGLKNDLEQVGALRNYFDWALNEQCFFYDECELLLPFIQQGKPVFGIEYQNSSQSFCPQANAMNFDFLRKRLSLDAWLVPCR